MSRRCGVGRHEVEEKAGSSGRRNDGRLPERGRLQGPSLEGKR
jgi:hypothetical protein